MKVLNLVQGTQEWLDARMSHFTASEAPAMMGDSKYSTRNQLLTLKKSGVSAPVDKHTQKIFDAGHQAEESARQFVEMDQLEEFLPLVGSIEIDGLKLLASFDGLNGDHSVVWEHKLFNKVLAENVTNKVLEPHYYWQLEHQLLVSGAEIGLFTCSDGTEESAVSMFYESVPERREALIAGWKQFAIDLANHEVKAKQEKLVANEIEELPTLEISLIGSVNSSNLAVYQSTALAFIKSINTDLQTDQDFVDAEKAVKFCKAGEDELKKVKTAALNDTADIKALFEAIDELSEEMRQKRLTLDKLVKSRKAEIKNEILAKATQELDSLTATLSAELQGLTLTHTANFVEAMKNKRNLESIHNAVDSELARCKIEINEKAGFIRENLKSLHELANSHQFLFSDWAALVSTKANDDLINLIKSRIADHKAAEEKHQAEQREKIRLEEEVKAKAKAEAELKAKQEEEAKQELAQAKQQVSPELVEKVEAMNEKPVADRLAERFKEQPSVDKEVEPIQQVANIQSPTMNDVDAFVEIEWHSVAHSFGILLLSNDESITGEALMKIRASFQQFMQQQAA